MVALTTVISLLAVIALIAANAFFVADEFALVAVDRSQVNVRASTKDRPWTTVQALLQELSFHLSAAQVGITISSLIVGWIAAPVGRTLVGPLVDGVFGEGTADWLTVPLAFILANVLQVVMGEVVPKTFAIAEPIRVLRVLAPGIAAWGWLVRPVVKSVNNLADRIVGKLGMEPGEELAGVTSMTELEHVIRASGEEGTLDPEDVTRLTRTIRFADKSADDILVPRVDLVVLHEEATLSDLCEQAGATGHSRFPVIGDDTDDVLGIVHVKAALGVEPQQRGTLGVADYMSEVFVVPETRELDTLLGEMYGDGHHLAVVLDEHGGVAGIVTIEDIVEEIVGEIDDEHDRQSLDDVREIATDTFVVAASMQPDELAEATGISLPIGDYETVAGFVLDRFQQIPETGDGFDWDRWHVSVVEMERWRIAKLRFTATAPAPSPDSELS